MIDDRVNLTSQEVADSSLNGATRDANHLARMLYGIAQITMAPLSRNYAVSRHLLIVPAFLCPYGTLTSCPQSALCEMFLALGFASVLNEER